MVTAWTAFTFPPVESGVDRRRGGERKWSSLSRERVVHDTRAGSLQHQIEDRESQGRPADPGKREPVVRSCPTPRTHTEGPWTVARQAPLSLGLSRREYWSGLHALLQGTFLTRAWNPRLLCLLVCRRALDHCARDAQWEPVTSASAPYVGCWSGRQTSVATRASDWSLVLREKSM